ncbi:unnamed protein product [Lupinus luteus]|uniref:Uncharacterized protein n=1 Tax=Lupinus luteus TaxID=3873 RepID=A0AAV1VR72_LUPLU
MAKESKFQIDENKGFRITSLSFEPRFVRLILVLLRQLLCLSGLISLLHNLIAYFVSAFIMRKTVETVVVDCASIWRDCRGYLYDGRRWFKSQQLSKLSFWQLFVTVHVKRLVRFL